MTSGAFSTCPIDQIIINREDRQRRVLENIPDLAASISRRGLMHPPVITRDFVLVAGERRMEALRMLGWDIVPFQFADEAPIKELKKIEIEENLKREDLCWQDRIDAIRTIHELERSDNPDWTHNDTADAIGLNRGYVSELMIVAKNMHKPEIAQQPNLAGARRIVKVQEQRRTAAEEESLGYGSVAPQQDQPVLCARFEDWVREYDGPRFNLIHCDFPYGIGFDKMGGQAGIDYARYEDSADTYIALLDHLINNLDKIAEDSCHLVFWFSIQNYEYTFNTLTKRGGFVVDPFPLVWLKSDNTGILPDPARGPRRIYETAFFARRGDRMIVKPKANAVAWPSTGKIHPHEKPQEMLQFFFEMLVDEHSSLLDPTCGSGSALRAARSLGAPRILGLEADEHYVRLANAEILEKGYYRS